jgi:hypothetical protein
MTCKCGIPARRCEHHFECAPCKKVHSTDYRCGKCNRCRRTCVCRPGAGGRGNGLAATTPGGSAAVPFGKPGFLNSMPRSLGVELELARWGSLAQTPAKHYRCHRDHDGSVSSGQELVVAPLSGDAFVKGMTELAKHLFANRCTVDQTCGFHVHVDGRDLGFFELRRLLYLYLGLEQDIYSLLLTRQRAANHERYFTRCADDVLAVLPRLQAAGTTHDIKHEIVRLLYGVELRQPPPVPAIGAPPPAPTYEQLRESWLVCELCRSRDDSYENTYALMWHHMLGGTHFPEDIRRIRDDNGDPVVNRAGVLRLNDANDLMPLLARRGVISISGPGGAHRASGADRSYINFNTIRGGKYARNSPVRSRYWGLNLHSWFFRGTVEFRMFQGTTAVDDLVCWPLLCGWIVHAATIVPDATALGVKGLGDFLNLTHQGRRIVPKFLSDYATRREQCAA